jgi:uncharacterized coiled-coil protein SlyX
MMPAAVAPAVAAEPPDWGDAVGVTHHLIDRLPPWVAAVLLTFVVVVAMFYLARRFGLLESIATPRDGVSAPVIREIVTNALDMKINGSLIRLERELADQRRKLEAINDKLDAHGERLAGLEARVGRAWTQTMSRRSGQ